MTSKREIRARVECRGDEGRSSPGRVKGTLIEMGRVSAGRLARPELFAPGSIQWPAGGIRLLAKHYDDPPVLTFQPIVDGAALRIDAELPDTEIGRRVAREIRSGKRSDLSIEFYPSDEQTVGGVREVTRAMVDCVALAETGTGVYDQARVEVRAKPRGRRLWR